MSTSRDGSAAAVRSGPPGRRRSAPANAARTDPARRPDRAEPSPELRVDWTACDGRGLCAELLPEMISTDDWGYPILRTRRVPPELAEHARRAVNDCPTMALRLSRPM